MQPKPALAAGQHFPFRGLAEPESREERLCVEGPEGRRGPGVNGKAAADEKDERSHLHQCAVLGLEPGAETMGRLAPDLGIPSGAAANMGGVNFSTLGLKAR